MDATVRKWLLDAVMDAERYNESYVVESSIGGTYVWSMESAAAPQVNVEYISKSPEVYLVCPDGSVTLLSRDEAAVCEFAMLWELAR